MSWIAYPGQRLATAGKIVSWGAVLEIGQELQSLESVNGHPSAVALAEAEELTPVDNGFLGDPLD
jgi:hypothetical protein